MVVALNLVISENPLKTRGDKKHIIYPTIRYIIYIYLDIVLFHIAIVGFPIKLVLICSLRMSPVF